MPGESRRRGHNRETAVSAEALFRATIVLGIISLVLAAVFNSYALALFSPDRQLVQETVTRIHSSQIRFLIVGISVILAAVILRRLAVFRVLSRHQRITNITLMIVALALFIFTADNILGVSYYPDDLTTIFIEDDLLGWRLRPNGDDYYGSAHYKINSKGLRSPHSEYRKPADTRRILHLGDSVTIGHGLPYEGTSAYILEEMLGELHRGYAVQVINAGCDGYSPWQEYEFLRSEGYKYEPDLVMVGFVLNDVTEKFGLVRFGGNTAGGQLRHTRQYAAISRFPLYRALTRTPIYLFLKDRFLKARLGKNIREGAKRLEELQVRDLVFNHDNELVDQAWETTLGNLQKISTYCSDNEIEMLVVIYPFAFQLDLSDSMAYPQFRVRDFCQRNDIRCVDLLPVFSEEMRRTGNEAEYYFKDQYHPAIEGNRVTSRVVLDYIVANGLLEPDKQADL